jgi:hypothetical protein
MNKYLEDIQKAAIDRIKDDDQSYIFPEEFYIGLPLSLNDFAALDRINKNNILVHAWADLKPLRGPKTRTELEKEKQQEKKKR